MNDRDGPAVPRRRRLWWGLAALAVAAVALYAARDAFLGAPVETYAATRGDLVQTVVASGRVMSPRRVSVGAVITERVVRIPVEEGQRVRRGDLLIQLDDREERAAVAQAQATIAQAEAKLRLIDEVGLPAAQQALAQARANATQTQAAFDRARDLRTKGFLSQAALDDAQRNRDVAASQLAAAQLVVASNAATGGDRAVAQTALTQARANLAAAQARLEQTAIVAEVDGTLIARNVEPGNVVQPGKELMVLAPAGATQVELAIDEKHLAQLKLGQKAIGSADAYPAQRFAAEVAYINPGVDALRGAVAVKLAVPAPPDYLRQDMTVSMDIEVARRSGVVIAPADAVRDAVGGAPWVLVVRDGVAVRQPVTVGLRGDDRVELASGVAADEALVPAGNPAIRPGQRVRASPAPRAP